MAAIDWDSLFSKLSSDGQEMLSVLKPYLPALAREGPEVYEGFIKHIYDGDWAAVDQFMYAKMTLEERRQLEDEVYKDAVAAAKAKYSRTQLLKDIGFKVALRVLMLVIVG